MWPQTQPTPWSCLPTAFAIVTDQSANDLITLIGHDGGEMISDEVRAFHPQEIIWQLRKDWHITEYCEAITDGTYTSYPAPMLPLIDRFNIVKETNNCVCAVANGESLHALAWDHMNHYFIDPKNNTYTRVLEGTLELFWSITRNDKASHLSSLSTINNHCEHPKDF